MCGVVSVDDDDELFFLSLLQSTTAKEQLNMSWSTPRVFKFCDKGLRL